MSWTKYFSKIYVLNLKKRTDRLLQVYEELGKYGIDFDLVTSIENEQAGAEGLRETMQLLFEDSIANKYERIIIFEDDVEFVCDPNPTMNEVVKQFPDKFDMIFMGCQPTCGFHYRFSPNLLQLDGAFSTHAVIYSLEGMKEILSQGLEAPIDNCYVAKVERLQRCYAIDPFLASQRESFSDIGKTVINWKPFLETRHQQKLAEL